MNEKLKRNIIFVAKFFAIFTVLHALLYIVPLDSLQNWLAGTEAGFFGLSHEKNAIFLGKNSFEINESCTGLVSAIILAGVVFSLRRPEIKKKIALFLAGFAVLFVANIARVYLVIAAALSFGAEWADLLHTLSWFSTAALILLLWYYLTKKVAGIRNFSELL